MFPFFTAWKEEGTCSKGHCPRRTPAKCYPVKQGGVRDALIVYMKFIAGEVSVNRIQSERWQTKPVLLR